MRRKSRTTASSQGTPAWMLTFGDMNTLLLTFFVMIIATVIKTVPTQNFSLIVSSYKGAVGFLEGGNTLTAGGGQLANFGNTVEQLPSTQAGDNLYSAAQAIGEALKSSPRVKGLKIEKTALGYKIVLPSGLFFKPAGADIDSDQAKDILQKLGMALNSLPAEVKLDVLAHSDSMPIQKNSRIAKIYPTTWELTSAQASAIVRYLEGFGISASRLSASGKADSEPVNTSNTTAGRLENRRVELYLYQK